MTIVLTTLEPRSPTLLAERSVLNDQVNILGQASWSPTPGKSNTKHFFMFRSVGASALPRAGARGNNLRSWNDPDGDETGLAEQNVPDVEVV